MSLDLFNSFSLPPSSFSFLSSRLQALHSAFIYFLSGQFVHGFSVPDWVILSVCSWFWLEIIYFACSAYFAYTDLIDPDEEKVKNMKLQPHKFNRSKLRRRYISQLPYIIRNHVFISLPLMMLSAYYSEHHTRFSLVHDSFPSPHYPLLPSSSSSSSSSFSLTSLLSCIVFLCYQVFGMCVVEEVLFYYFHRLFHESTQLFVSVHAMHHENDAPYAAAATYAHPIEHAFVNIMPLLLGPVLFSCHFYVCLSWWVLATINTCFTHSGFKDKQYQAEKHDSHHAMTKVDYGIFGVLDALHQTRLADFMRRKKRNNAHEEKTREEKPRT